VSTGQPFAFTMAPMSGMAPMGGMAPMTFSPMTPVEPWWPAELGAPSSTGAQNTLRYALFPAAHRLVVERDGRVSVHDCGDAQITGCSQASGEGVRFTTTAGTISLDSLPEVRPAPAPPVGAAAAEAPESGGQDAVLDALAKLGTLKEKGILTEEEFAAKKAELLGRL